MLQDIAAGWFGDVECGGGGAPTGTVVRYPPGEWCPESLPWAGYRALWKDIVRPAGSSFGLDS
jgi:hypothetical protein